MLRQDPPLAVAQVLAGLSIQPADLILCTQTDIDRLGHYEEQWLAVTDSRVVIVHAGCEPRALMTIAVADVTEFRCQTVIGSGLLQARMDGMYVDLLRYSNRMADRFHKVAAKLECLRKGEPVQFHPEDEIDPRRCQSCGLMLQFVGDVCPRCVNRGAVLMRMWSLLRPYWRSAAVMMFLLLIGIGLDLVAPQLTRRLVDHVLPGNAEATARIAADLPLYQQLLGVLLSIVGVLAGVQLLRMMVNIAQGVIGARIGSAMTFDMRGRLVDHLQQLSVAYYDRQQVGSLVGRVAYDTEALHGFIHQLTGGFLFQLIMVVGVGSMMFSLNPKLALFTLIPSPLVVAGSIVFWRHIYPRYYRFWDASSKQAGMLSGTLSGIRVVKAFSQEGRESERFNTASGNLRGNRLNVDNATALFNPVMGLVFQLGGWIVWYVGGRDVLGGHMTLGSLIAFFAYLAMFYGPLTMLTQFTNWLTQFATQAHRIFEILDTPVEIVECAEPVSLPEIAGGIRFQHVTFGYTRHAPVLQDVDFEIQPGEMIGVVGRSGSGKTTIINLLTRFYDVDAGSVLIDGVDVRHVTKNDLRRQIGVVLQEPFLFRGSIWQNVAYGRPEATPEEVITSARAGNCHDFIMRQAHGYDTWVGERGAGLSGGERQRIGIARVLLTDPRILILDEATSSVDAESEASIQAALAEVVKGRTTIAIAHRLSTLRNAHRIMVVDHGRIVETGTHKDLIERDGLYAHLVRIQGQLNIPTVEQITAFADELEGLPEASAEAAPGALPHPRSHHPRWLTPENARLHLGNLGTLHATIPGEAIYNGVYALRCMPVKYPDQYISLRYLNDEKREIEVGLVRNLADWPTDVRQLIAESLLKRYFVHSILSIRQIDQYNGYLNFKVETDLGPLEFMMRWQGDRAHDYGRAGKMLLDTEDNRYLIPDIGELIPAERALFQRFIYW